MKIVFLWLVLASFFLGVPGDIWPTEGDEVVGNVGASLTVLQNGLEGLAVSMNNMGKPSRVYRGKYAHDDADIYFEKSGMLGLNAEYKNEYWQLKEAYEQAERSNDWEAYGKKRAEIFEQRQRHAFLKKRYEGKIAWLQEIGLSGVVRKLEKAYQKAENDGDWRSFWLELQSYYVPQEFVGDLETSFRTGPFFDSEYENELDWLKSAYKKAIATGKWAVYEKEKTAIFEKKEKHQKLKEIFEKKKSWLAKKNYTDLYRQLVNAYINAKDRGNWDLFERKMGEITEKGSQKWRAEDPEGYAKVLDGAYAGDDQETPDAGPTQAVLEKYEKAKGWLANKKYMDLRLQLIEAYYAAKNSDDWDLFEKKMEEIYNKGLSRWEETEKEAGERREEETEHEG